MKDGDWVRARALDGGATTRLAPGPVKNHSLVGVLTVHSSRTTGEKRYSVAGISVDPASIQEIPRPD